MSLYVEIHTVHDIRDPGPTEAHVLPIYSRFQSPKYLIEKVDPFTYRVTCTVNDEAIELPASSVKFLKLARQEPVKAEEPTPQPKARKGKSHG